MKLGLEDDAYLYRVYSPHGEDALQITPRSSPDSATSAADSEANSHLIMKMLKNVHIAATAEALNFGSELGLPGWNLYHIVEGAAGASAMFTTTAPAMLRRDFSRENKDVPSVLEAIEELVSPSGHLHI